MYQREIFIIDQVTTNMQGNTSIRHFHNRRASSRDCAIFASLATSSIKPATFFKRPNYLRRSRHLRVQLAITASNSRYAFLLCLADHLRNFLKPLRNKSVPEGPAMARIISPLGCSPFAVGHLWRNGK